MSSFEERMQQLGRKATQQEPQELALPRCVRASESVKPISCVKHRVQRHGFGEGRLPIPDLFIRDKEDASDARRQQQQQWQGAEHKAAAGKLLRPSQQLAQQQADAVKARKSAAKAFSAAVEQRRIAERHAVSNGKSDSSSSSSRRSGAPQPAAPVTHQPLVERHLPRCAAAGTSTPAAAAAAAGHGDDSLPAASPGTGADCKLQPEGAAAAAGQAASPEPVEPAAEQVCMASRTFLTDATSQPSSPVRHAAAGSAAAAAGVGALFAAPERAAILLEQPGSSEAAASAAAVHTDGSQHAEPAPGGVADASSRLLSFAAHCPPADSGVMHKPAPPFAVASSAAAAATPRAAACSSPVQRPGSPPVSLRPCGPHWSPVPPRTQLHPPVVVRPMANWVLDQEPMQELPPQPPPQPPPQQQQQQSTASGPVAACRPAWQGGKGAAAAAGTSNTAALQAEASQTGSVAGRGSTSRRRVSVSSISLRGGAARAHASSGSGSVPGAAFTSTKLAQLVASAADKVAMSRLVLPALCSCGHSTSTSVLDASYPTRCCTNCPLRGHPEAYERLLVGLLSGMGLD